MECLKTEISQRKIFAIMETNISVAEEFVPTIHDFCTGDTGELLGA